MTTDRAAGRAGRPDLVTRAFTLLTERAVSLHAAALLRIGYGLLYLAFLLREFPHRDEMWGPGSPWSPGLARELQGETGWFSVLTLSDRPAYFQACYALALLTCLLFALGWRTRVLSLVFALVVTSFHGRAIFMTDGGDNLIVLMSLYLPFTACGRRWSLDARRTRTPGPASQAALVRRRVVTVLHNCGMAVMAAQVCVLYGAAGLLKVQGDQWRNGTALHYVLGLPEFQPWPGLSQLADQFPLLLAIAGYVTVLVQVAVPFTLFGRLKYPVLVTLCAMHLGIAVLLGLPFFSGAMLVADAVFLPDRLLTRLRRRPRPAPPSDAVIRADAAVMT